MSTKIDFRWRGRRHLDAAHRLLKSGDSASLRYACLELRMCIEALAYDRLRAYLAEVPNSVMKKWTPRQILDELLAIDPYADRSSTVYVGAEEQVGVPAQEMKLLGEDRMFSVKWANSAHNTLGNFLHVPTFAQIEARKEATDEKIRKKAGRIASTLEQVLSSRIWNVNLAGRFYTFECLECKFVIKRRAERLHDPRDIICGSCGAIYDAVETGDDQAKFRVRTVEYECFDCGAKHSLRFHKIKIGQVIKCTCGAKVRAEGVLRFVPLDRGAGTGQ